jgi:hypothetical protein
LRIPHALIFDNEDLRTCFDKVAVFENGQRVDVKERWFPSRAHSAFNSLTFSSWNEQFASVPGTPKFTALDQPRDAEIR